MSPFDSQPMNRTSADTRKRTWVEASGHKKKKKKVPKVRNKTRPLPATKNAPQAIVPGARFPVATLPSS